MTTKLMITPLTATTLMPTRLMAMRPRRLPWMSVAAGMTILRRLPGLPKSTRTTIRLVAMTMRLMTTALMLTRLMAMRPHKLPRMSVAVAMTMLRRLPSLPNSMRMTIPLAGMITIMVTTATITRMPTPLQTGLLRSLRPMR
jgi:hypothetical protein